MNKNQKGFTLIELMIVVAIIGILAAVAIPKFAEMMERSRDGATKGNIGALKSAISIYYGDHDGSNPTDLTAVFVPATNPTGWNFIAKYIDNIPSIKSQGANKINVSTNPNKCPWGGGGQSANYVYQTNFTSVFTPAINPGGPGIDLMVPTAAGTAAGVGFGYKYESLTGLIYVNCVLLDMSSKPYTLFGYD